MGKLLTLAVVLMLSLVLSVHSVGGVHKPVDKAAPASEAEGRDRERNQRVRYTASWAVQIDGGEKMADTIAKRNGFRNRGKVRERGREGEFLQLHVVLKPAEVGYLLRWPIESTGGAIVLNAAGAACICHARVTCYYSRGIL